MDVAQDGLGVVVTPLHHIDAFGRTAPALRRLRLRGETREPRIAPPAVRELRELVGYRAEHH